MQAIKTVGAVFQQILDDADDVLGHGSALEEDGVGPGAAPLGIGHDSRFALVFTIVKIALARGSELLAIGYDDDARVAAAARHRSDYARLRPCRRYENLQNTPAAL